MNLEYYLYVYKNIIISLVMCGIFSILNNSSFFTKKNINEQFLKGIKRGPDNSQLKEEVFNYILGFHRLSINGLDELSNQPITINDITLICNGEIYNYKDLYHYLNIESKTNSDCEIIIHLYEKFGIEQTLRMLDGVFAFIIVDSRINNVTPIIHIARDPFGVRPLYYISNDNNDSSINNFYAFASEVKVLSSFYNKLNNEKYKLKHFPPGHYATFKYRNNIHSIWNFENIQRYHTTGFHNIITNNQTNINNILENIRYYFKKAVFKRCDNSDRPVGCLLSGGLDSSLVCSLANQYCKENNLPPIRTFSIGVKGSKDLEMAKCVANYIGTQHTEIEIKEQDFIDNIEEVIYNIETYDTTTIRASIGNYLIGKYIKENTNIIVVLNGDGSDELCGGYLYMHKAPSDLYFDYETHNLLNEIHAFDVLRSDKSISSHGLEPRTPFLDREWVQYYLSIPIKIRNHSNEKKMEKYLLRKAFSEYKDYDNKQLLPNNILWRSKEAFSDGVSTQNRSLFEILQEHIEKQTFDYKEKNHSFIPQTKEQKYYKFIFDKYYSNCENLIPRYWMPKFIEATDSSARTLSIYSEVSNDYEK